MTSLGLDTFLILYLVAVYAWTHHLDEAVALKTAWKSVTLTLSFSPEYEKYGWTQSVVYVLKVHTLGSNTFFQRLGMLNLVHDCYSDSQSVMPTYLIV